MPRGSRSSTPAAERAPTAEPKAIAAGEQVTVDGRSVVVLQATALLKRHFSTSKNESPSSGVPSI